MTISKASTLSPTAILHNIEERSQLLVERGLNEQGQPVMAFSHLTFQEYLAAVALKESIGEHRESTISKELIERYKTDPDWWEEVALLYAAQLEDNKRKPFMDQLYPKQEPSQ
jgi:predicted NACHT family NTPase